MDDLANKYNEKYKGKLNKSTISRYENDLQEPMLFVVNNLSDFFSVSIDYLTGKEKPATEAGSGLAESLQAPYMQEIHDTLLKLKPETRKLILAQIEAAKAFEDDAKK